MRSRRSPATVWSPSPTGSADRPTSGKENPTSALRRKPGRAGRPAGPTWGDDEEESDRAFTAAYVCAMRRFLRLRARARGWAPTAATIAMRSSGSATSRRTASLERTRSRSATTASSTATSLHRLRGWGGSSRRATSPAEVSTNDGQSEARAPYPAVCAVLAGSTSSQGVLRRFLIGEIDLPKPASGAGGRGCSADRWEERRASSGHNRRCPDSSPDDGTVRRSSSMDKCCSRRTGFDLLGQAQVPGATPSFPSPFAYRRRVAVITGDDVDLQAGRPAVRDYAPDRRHRVSASN